MMFTFTGVDKQAGTPLEKSGLLDEKIVQNEWTLKQGFLFVRRWPIKGSQAGN